jgi:hypothetical protein
MGIDHAYEPDFLVRLTNNVTLLVEVKGYEDDVIRAKHNAAPKRSRPRKLSRTSGNPAKASPWAV